MRTIKPIVLFAVAGFLFASPDFARAANFTVQVSNFAFTPASRSIAVGDTVIWTNTTTTGHTTTSGTSCTANSGQNTWGDSLGSHATVTIIFTNYPPGTYPYFCIPHCASENMVGSLTVTSSVVPPPSVTITNPVSGSQFAAPANITLMAGATQSGGTVTNVQFFSGTSLLSNDTSAPYSFTVNGAVTGTYNFTAVAMNNQGGAATSSVVSVTVFAPSVTITNPLTGARFIAPANITLMANAAQTGGTITNVQFLSGSSLLGNATGAPFNFTVDGAAAGNYNFSAVAKNNNGGAATSAVVNVVVQTNALLSGPIFSSGQFQLTINGIAGQTYELDSSSNLLDWVPVSTNVAPSDTFNVIDPTANGAQRFYRIRQSF